MWAVPRKVGSPYLAMTKDRLWRDLKADKCEPPRVSPTPPGYISAWALWYVPFRLLVFPEVLRFGPMRTPPYSPRKTGGSTHMVCNMLHSASIHAEPFRCGGSAGPVFDTLSQTHGAVVRRNICVQAFYSRDSYWSINAIISCRLSAPRIPRQPSSVGGIITRPF